MTTTTQDRRTTARFRSTPKPHGRPFNSQERDHNSGQGHRGEPNLTRKSTTENVLA